MALSISPEQPSCLEATVSFPDLLGSPAPPPEDCVLHGHICSHPTRAESGWMRGGPSH